MLHMVVKNAMHGSYLVTLSVRDGLKRSLGYDNVSSRGKHGI